MTIGAYVYNIHSATYQSAQLRLDTDILFYDDAQNPVFATADTLSVFAALGATTAQIGAAIGTAVRAYALATYGLTIPANNILVMNFAKV